MQIPKKMLIPMAALAVVVAGAYGVAQVSAASSPSGTHTSLAQRIADAFHLDQSKVQAVIDQQHQENQATRESKYETRLSQAVTAGKLTSAQKDLILAEHNKLAGELQTAMSGSAADRRTAMKNIRSESKAWAAQNNIAEKWLIGPGRLRGGHGAGQPVTTPTPTPTAAS
jgi:hypothetical protein